jgi:hypothetical protein
MNEVIKEIEKLIQENKTRIAKIEDLIRTGSLEGDDKRQEKAYYTEQRKELIGQNSAYLRTQIMIEAKIRNKKARQLKNKEYIFNFESGGWNTVHAKTVKGAIKIANEKYKDSPSLNPDPSTFRLATDKELRFLGSLFW